MEPLVLAACGIGGMFVLIALHVPIGVAMGLAGFVSVGLMIGWTPALSVVKTEVSAVISHRDLGVIPLFLLMGSFAGVGGLSADLYRLAYALVGHYRGGLAMATIGGCAGFGAVCGSSVATAATMARVALPEMTDRKYDPALATGAIASGGTLGLLIPPSIIMVLYGILTEQFIIALFIAAIVPGLISVAFYLITIYIIVRFKPQAGPAGSKMSWAERWQTVWRSWRVLTLAFVVSGGIYGGVFTVVEAASVGAALAGLFAWMGGRLNWRALRHVLGETAASTGLIYLIIIGAHIFTYFVTLSHLSDSVVTYIQSLDLSPFLVMALLMVMYIVLGSIFDTVASLVITLPFVFPLIVGLGFDPIWFGVIIVMAIEIGMITPPIGINVFVLHGMARSVPLATIYRGILPFFAADIGRLSLLIAFPILALWLPRAMNMPT